MMDIDKQAELMIPEVMEELENCGVYDLYLNLCEKNAIDEFDILSIEDFTLRYTNWLVRVPTITEWLELKQSQLNDDGDVESEWYLSEELHTTVDGIIGLALEWDQEEDVIFINPFFQKNGEEDMEWGEVEDEIEPEDWQPDEEETVDF